LKIAKVTFKEFQQAQRTPFRWRWTAS